MVNLNEVFPPALAPVRNRNINLSPEEIATIMRVQINMERKTEYTWKDAIYDLSHVIKTYNNPAGSTKGLGGNIKFLPLVLIQIIYYISYKYNITQQQILDELKKHGINRDKKLFNMEVHVDDYKKCVEYNQPELHICYQGQKRDILAEAIKHLVFQAGTYDCFIDIFGGSGAATLAVPRRNNAVYVFNDLDFGLYCLFDTIADDEEYKQLIQYIKDLQNDLAGKGVFKLLDVVGTTFSKEIILYAHNKKRKIQREKLLVELANIYTGNGYPSEYYEVERQYRFYGWYCYFSNILEDKQKLKLIKNNVSVYAGKEIEDRVIIALAEFYIWSFTTHSSKGVSPILQMVYSVEEIYQYKKENKVWQEFINEDYAKVIRNIHKLIRKNRKFVDKSKDYKNKTPMQEQKTITECYDYSDLIDMYSVGGNAKCKHEKPLFYADYPYQGTTGYSVGGWTGVQSRDLIDRLVNSGGKFVFSCRACATTKTNSNTPINTVKKINNGIYDDVLNYFRTKGTPLWVARFSTEKQTFIDALRNNNTTEVMITNFELQDFTYKSGGAIETMSYKLFMKDIDKYLVR